MSSPSTFSAHDSQRLLCLDLDGTLIATDTLDECLLRIVRTRPWLLLRMPLWLTRGKAYFKDRVAENAADLLGKLPYRKEVVDFIRENADDSTTIVLATAANERIAQKVAADHPFIEDILASDSATNLSGSRKLDRILQYAQGREFDYVGDARCDLPIWQKSRRAVVVGKSKWHKNKFGLNGQSVLITPQVAVSFKTWMKQLRVHQWSKNVLILVPLFLAHRWGVLPDLARALVAMLSFSFLASAVYIFNDMLDLPFDRAHPTKRTRPLCSGAITIRQAALMATALIFSSLAMAAAFLPPAFVRFLGGYLLLNSLYTLWLKKEPVVDVLLLSSFYAYRVFVGGVAIGVSISPWLLAFSLFFFFGLGMVKRFSDSVEYVKQSATVELQANGRGYVADDSAFLLAFGSASSCVAVLVMVLYLSSSEVLQLYSRPELLWFTCPLMLFWVSRVWFFANRGQMPSDPIVFALRDPISYVVGFLVASLVLIASV